MLLLIKVVLTNNLFRTINHMTDQIRPEIMKQFSAKDLWQTGEHEQIFDRLRKSDRLNRRINPGGYRDDYRYDAGAALDLLDLKELAEDDEKLIRTRELAQGNERHFLVDLRKREILLENLMPMLEKMPAYNREKVDIGEGQFPIDAGNNEFPAIDQEDIAVEDHNEYHGSGRMRFSQDIFTPRQRTIEIIHSLMWDALTAAQGRGKKSLAGLEGVELKRLEEILGKNISSFDPILEYNAILENLRGEELKNLIGEMFKRSKDKDIALAREQGIETGSIE
jgi:hypothetical protein